VGGEVDEMTLVKEGKKESWDTIPPNTPPLIVVWLREGSG